MRRSRKIQIKKALSERWGFFIWDELKINRCYQPLVCKKQSLMHASLQPPQAGV